MRRCIAGGAVVVVLLLLGITLTQVDRADEPLVVSIGEQLGGGVDFAAVTPAVVEPGEHVLGTITAHNVVPLAVVQVASTVFLSESAAAAAWNYNGLKTSPSARWDGVLLPDPAHSRSPALVLLL